MFTGERSFDTMANAMRPEDADALVQHHAAGSVVDRAQPRHGLHLHVPAQLLRRARIARRASDNIVLPGTAMPHVLWQLQGTQRAVFAPTSTTACRYSSVSSWLGPGELAAKSYDNVVRDIVNFLDYIGEPIKRERQQLGIRVIGFLLVFLLIAYMLKKEIWKDVK